MTDARGRAAKSQDAWLDALDPSGSTSDAFLALSACCDASEHTARRERELARARELFLVSFALFAVVIVATIAAPGVPDALSAVARIAACALYVWRLAVVADRMRDRTAAQEDEARLGRRFGDDLGRVERELALEKSAALRQKRLSDDRKEPSCPAW